MLVYFKKIFFSLTWLQFSWQRKGLNLKTFLINSKIMISPLHLPNSYDFFLTAQQFLLDGGKEKKEKKLPFC